MTAEVLEALFRCRVACEQLIAAAKGLEKDGRKVAAVDAAMCADSVRSLTERLGRMLGARSTP